MIIARYLRREILRTLLATLGGLLLVLIINQSVHFMNQAAAGQLSLVTVVWVILLEVPTLLTYICPLALMISILVALGRLASDHELVALRACGYTTATLYRTVLAQAICMSLLVLWLSGFVSPVSHSWQKSLLLHSVSELDVNKMMPGRFINLGHSDRVLYTDIKRADPSSRQVFFAQKHHDGNQAWSILSANRLHQQSLPSGAKIFEFSRGVQYELSLQQPSWEVLRFSTYRLQPTPIANTPSQSLSTWSLMRLYANRHHPTQVTRVAWQWRFALPLAVFVLALLAIPLSEINPRQGKLMRLLPAAFIYIAYVNCLFVSKQWLLAARYPLFIGLWWLPLFVAAVWGVWQLSLHMTRFKRRRRST